MKYLKVAAVVVAISMLFVACAFGSAEEEAAEFGHGILYPKLTIVVINQFEEETGLWIVSCVDKDGELWDFKSDTDSWERGDIVNLMMFDNGNTKQDQKVQEVYWEGYTEDIISFFNSASWYPECP